MVLCDWLLLLGMLSGFFLGIAGINTSFFLLQIIFHYMGNITFYLFIPQLMDIWVVSTL